jgi:hypothetical protein
MLPPSAKAIMPVRLSTVAFHSTVVPRRKIAQALWVVLATALCASSNASNASNGCEGVRRSLWNERVERVSCPCLATWASAGTLPRKVGKARSAGRQECLWNEGCRAFSF